MGVGEGKGEKSCSSCRCVTEATALQSSLCTLIIIVIKNNPRATASTIENLMIEKSSKDFKEKHRFFLIIISKYYFPGFSARPKVTKAITSNPYKGVFELCNELPKKLLPSAQRWVTFPVCWRDFLQNLPCWSATEKHRKHTEVGSLEQHPAPLFHSADKSEADWNPAGCMGNALELYLCTELTLSFVYWFLPAND